jgi:hypothetical protein
MDAEKILAEAGVAQGIHLDPKVVDDIQRRLAQAVQQSLARLEPFDHLGAGQAKVDRVASTRRCKDASGVIHVRYSAGGKDPAMKAFPEGRIDPYLKTITLARGEKPLVRLHYYATHPQTRYGDGRATSDCAGIARETLEQKEGVFQIYFNGCGGDITVGKYNDGADHCRVELASRLQSGMEASIAATKLVPAGPVQWRTYPIVFSQRTDAGFSPAECLAGLRNPKTAPVIKLYACALRIAFHQRRDQPIELNSLQIGDVRIVHLPGEPMLDFQLYAQSLKPAGFVAVAGYGNCATGYICPTAAFREGGYEPTDCNIKPESEALVKKAIAALLEVE